MTGCSAWIASPGPNGTSRRRASGASWQSRSSTATRQSCRNRRCVPTLLVVVGRQELPRAQPGWAIRSNAVPPVPRVRSHRSEREQVRLNQYHTERVLACSPVLAPLGRIAGLHHERLDGSGYHPGLAGTAIPFTCQGPRRGRHFPDPDAGPATPRRPRPPSRGASGRGGEGRAARHRLRAGRGRGRGAGTGTGPDQPRGLSDREVEVLRLVARGLTNRQIAEMLVISRRTAEHHVQHVYAKIGTSTRAAAALFAMEHDLLPR